MELLLFSCLNPERQYQECSFGAENIELCFDALNSLVNAGWQLIAVKLISCPDSVIRLPIEAFDGKSIINPLRELQQQWETVLQLR